MVAPAANNHTYRQFIRVTISLAAWLCVLLAIAGVWHVTQEPSVAPPTYDAYTFFSKFLSMSHMLSLKQWDLFDALPSIRPPGYLLINLLFNPSADPQGYRAFFFVSLIFPLFVWLIGCWLSVRAAAACQSNSIQIRKSTCLVIVAVLSCLPMFYAFEEGGWGYWGLVDSGLAAFAGLSAALCIRALLSRKIYLHMLAAMAAGFCFWIKPAGALVMVTIASLAVLGRWLQCLSVSKDSYTEMSRTSWRTVLLSYPLIYLAFIAPALASEYFSRPNLDYATEGAKTILALYPPGIYWFIALLRDSTGYLVPSLIGALAISGAYGQAQKQSQLRVANCVAWLLPFALLQLLASSLWWIFAAGFQTRYMFPFIAIAIVCTLPAISVCVERSIRLRFSNLKLLALCLPPAALAAALWSSPPVSKALQSALQIDITTGKYVDPVRLAKALTEESKRLQPPVYVSYGRPDAQTGVVEAYTKLAFGQRGIPPMFASSWKWSLNNVVNLHEITNSDFLILSKTNNQPSPTGEPASFDQELSLVFSFLRSIEDDSLIESTTFGDLVLQKIHNRDALAQTIRSFVAQQSWRPEFMAENHDFLNAYTSSLGPTNYSTLLDHNLQAHNIILSNDVGVTSDEQRVEVQIVGSDPYIIFAPTDSVSTNKATQLRIKMSAASPFALQVFFKQAGVTDFNERDSKIVNVPRGVSSQVITLPVSFETLQVRLDFGSATNAIQLKSVEVAQTEQ
jgi:hypothetical protein